jgi:hypothetical protein
VAGKWHPKCRVLFVGCWLIADVLRGMAASRCHLNGGLPLRRQPTAAARVEYWQASWLQSMQARSHQRHALGGMHMLWWQGVKQGHHCVL